MSSTTTDNNVIATTSDGGGGDITPKPKQWADDYGDDVENDIPQTSITTASSAPDDDTPPPAKAHFEADGTKVLTEYRINEDGKKVKVTLRMKVRAVKVHANKAVAQRKNWSKFGDAKGSPIGPDPSTTTYGEKVYLKLSTSQKDLEQAEPDDDALSKMKAKLSGTRIQCRICKGDHMTAKCPHKDSQLALDMLSAKESPNVGTPEAASVSEETPSSNTGKYIVPARRAGATAGSGESMNSRGRTDDWATIRITNLSDETTEMDLKNLMSRFGTTARVFVAREPKTNLCKGFAFVSFHDKRQAENAMNKLNGYGYGNLILRVEWAKTNTSAVK